MEKLFTKTTIKFVLGFLTVLIISFSMIAIAGHIAEQEDARDKRCGDSLC